jgi:hypothetical protein
MNVSPGGTFPVGAGIHCSVNANRPRDGYRALALNRPIIIAIRREEIIRGRHP